MLQVIFFVRLFADITGRMLPRMQRLAIESTFGLMALALAVTASIPLFFLYLKAPEAWLNDGIVIGKRLMAPLLSLSPQTCHCGTYTDPQPLSSSGDPRLPFS